MLTHAGRAAGAVANTLQEVKEIRVQDVKGIRVQDVKGIRVQDVKRI
jgi:hypothetical protein